jgi:ketosteroid isomerase-like protein
MAEGATETLLRSFARTLESRDLEKALSFFSPDAVYLNPSGRFTGTTEIRRYLRWMFETNSELQIVESGHVRQCGVPPSLHLRAN